MNISRNILFPNFMKVIHRLSIGPGSPPLQRAGGLQGHLYLLWLTLSKYGILFFLFKEENFSSITMGYLQKQFIIFTQPNIEVRVLPFIFMEKELNMLYRVIVFCCKIFIIFFGFCHFTYESRKIMEHIYTHDDQY